MKNISITIEKEQLEWLEAKVKEGKYANISHGIRYAITKLMEVNTHE